MKYLHYTSLGSSRIIIRLFSILAPRVRKGAHHCAEVCIAINLMISLLFDPLLALSLLADMIACLQHLDQSQTGHIQLCLIVKIGFNDVLHPVSILLTVEAQYFFDL